MRPVLAEGDRLVVKVGTASITTPDGTPDEARLAALCDAVAAAHHEGIHVVLVSSGAIAAGLGPLGLRTRPTDIPSLQAAAAVGQGSLLGAYSGLFAAHGITVGQVLLTRFDFMHRQQYVNARNTLDRLLALRTIPIVNENDTVAVDEIRFGDNDRLAALVSNLTRAELLVLLTNAEGLHTDDPRKTPDAPVIDEVERITPDLERAAGGRGSQLASGGMASKLAAAWVATLSGVGVVVADAGRPGVLGDAVAGRAVGTYFHPRPRRLSARRLWIAFAQPPRGTLTVDDGARVALEEGNRSLLGVGIVEVQGDFETGDTVDVGDRTGRMFARGLVRYGSDDLRAAIARRGDERGDEVIHRDQLVVLTP